MGRSRRWSMVVIRESPVDGCPDGKDGVLSVFPPSNHENLLVPSGPCDEQRSPCSILPPSSDLLPSPSQFFTSSSSSSSSSSCSSSFSPSDVDEELQEEPRPSDSAVQVGEPGRATWLLRLGFRVWGSKVFGAMSSFFGRGAARGGLFWLSVASAAAALWWVCARFRLLRLRHRERVDGLMRVVKERDEVSLVTCKVFVEIPIRESGYKCRYGWLGSVWAKRRIVTCFPLYLPNSIPPPRHYHAK